MHSEQKATCGLERHYSSKTGRRFGDSEFKSMEQSVIIQNLMGHSGKERLSLGPMGPPDIYEQNGLLGI